MRLSLRSPTPYHREPESPSSGGLPPRTRRRGRIRGSAGRSRGSSQHLVCTTPVAIPGTDRSTSSWRSANLALPDGPSLFGWPGLRSGPRPSSRASSHRQRHRALRGITPSKRSSTAALKDGCLCPQAEAKSPVLDAPAWSWIWVRADARDGRLGSSASPGLGPDTEAVLVGVAAADSAVGAYALVVGPHIAAARDGRSHEEERGRAAARGS